jgi:hypothetical protein
MCTQGIFPMSWKAASGKVKTLVLTGNTKLTGCVPFRISPGTFVEMNDTGLQGLCPVDTAAELRQRAALEDLLPQVLFGVGPASNSTTKGYNTMVKAAVAWSSKIGYL